MVNAAEEKKAKLKTAEKVLQVWIYMELELIFFNHLLYDIIAYSKNRYYMKWKYIKLYFFIRFEQVGISKCEHNTKRLETDNTEIDQLRQHTLEEIDQAFDQVIRALEKRRSVFLFKQIAIL